jgi:hypothetical protein
VQAPRGIAQAHLYSAICTGLHEIMPLVMGQMELRSVIPVVELHDDGGSITHTWNKRGVHDFGESVLFVSY